MSLLRFITCGSVDDGKSSLLGRLLWELQQIPDDQLAALQADSRRVGTRGAELDTALLLDGLSAEREQGITIDVAYRHFASPRRSFIAADTPGHEQYTRNMVTGASTADLAIVLVDAQKGVLQQTRRHTYLLGLVGVRQVILAVNKMDLVGWAEDRFAAIEAEYRQAAARVGIEHVTALPLCATLGDNVLQPSAHMPWCSTPPLLALLEAAPVDDERRALEPLRLPVQWVCRPDAQFRGYAGTLAAGTVQPGQRVRVLPSGRESTVARIVTADGDLQQAQAGQSITVTLADELDITRGDLLCSTTNPAETGRQFRAAVVWLHEAPLLRGRSYWLKIGTRTVAATVSPIRHKVNVHTLEEVATETLALNEIGVVELQLDRVIAFDPYERCRETGGFILIDREHHGTVGAGMLQYALRRSANVHWQALAVDKAARQQQAGHRSGVLWLTGLSGAGKSTLASALEARLHAGGHRTYVLDGDNLRHGLNKDLGFSAADRVENIRRVAEVARLLADAGVIVIVSFISPFRSERTMARELLGPGEFLEVHVHVPLALAEQRDAKGLYAKARRGELRNFTGIDSPYEAPESPELHLDMATLSVAEAVEQTHALVQRAGWLEPPQPA